MSKIRKSKATTEKYWVKLSRPVLQSIVLQVSARSPEDAVSRAVEAAEQLPDEDWRGKYDPDRYSLDVHGVLALEECEPDETGEDAFSYERTEYLLLRADTDAGEGQVIPQPWLDDCSHLMVADLCGDWMRTLEMWQQDGLGKFYDSMEKLRSDSKTPQRANVIAFLPYLNARRQKRDQNE